MRGVLLLVKQAVQTCKTMPMVATSRVSHTYQQAGVPLLMSTCKLFRANFA